jgi:two-component system, OmpR family, sensor histidine kinase AdeS
MMRLPFSRLLNQWRRQRQRWPLTWQITMVITDLMICNVVLIAKTLDNWRDYIFEQEFTALSPASQRIYRDVEKGVIRSSEDLKRLIADFEPVQLRVTDKLDAALYSLIAIAGGITIMVGYLLLGRVQRGLGSVAFAARRITDGDLTARARTVGFASHIEIQLISDFNIMSDALQRAERELAGSTASIAHELRTPLTILRGRLHGIADGVFALEPSEVRGLLYQVEGLGRLVDDPQTLSLANSQRLVLTVETTNLADKVRRIKASMGPDLAATGLEPTLALQATPLIADGARIRQIIAAVIAINV